MKDTSVIPYGPYCYDHKGLCPYWSSVPDAPQQEDGYCSFLEKGDIELNKEFGGMSLLWDQCKECGIKR